MLDKLKIHVIIKEMSFQKGTYYSRITESSLSLTLDVNSLAAEHIKGFAMSAYKLISSQDIPIPSIIP